MNLGVGLSVESSDGVFEDAIVDLPVLSSKLCSGLTPWC